MLFPVCEHPAPSGERYRCGRALEAGRASHDFRFVATWALGNGLLLCPRTGAKGESVLQCHRAREDTTVVDFEYTRPQGAHGHHLIGLCDAFVGSHREIWVGGDGSGLIRERSGPVSFFTEDGRAAWEAAGSRSLEHGPSVDLFAPAVLAAAA